MPREEEVVRPLLLRWGLLLRLLLLEEERGVPLREEPLSEGREPLREELLPLREELPLEGRELLLVRGAEGRELEERLSEGREPLRLLRPCVSWSKS